MRIRAITRGSLGGDAVYCAAYRGGRSLWNERTGDLYKHEGRQDVRDVGIVLPRALDRHPGMEWARNPHRLWNTAEFSEVQRNARVAREYMMILPEAMTFAQRRDLVHGFAQHLADRYGNAIDVALHDRRTGRARHFHAHLMGTSRKVGLEGLLEKIDAERSNPSRSAAHTKVRESHHVRQLWERSLRAAIHEAGLSAQTYDTLHREYGQGESAYAYRRRLQREGFDLRQQQREDRRKTQLTAEERQEAARRKWGIRKFRHLQRDARAERQSDNQRKRREGRAMEHDKRRLRCWIPRWDAREGLLKPWEVEPHLRRVGQTPSMVPWAQLENPGPEPQFKPDHLPVVERHHAPRTERPSDVAEASVERWLALRQQHPRLSERELSDRAIDSWLAQRNRQEQQAALAAPQHQRSYGLEIG